MVTVLGLDIGGANTKAALITSQSGKVQTIKVAVEYFPVWREPRKLTKVLLALKDSLNSQTLDCLGVTMTAELSDAYNTKREGVSQILDCVKQAFPNLLIYVLTTDAQMVPFKVAEETPLLIAAANWAATGWLVAQKNPNCVVVDVGSTSASIIPIVAGQVAAKGKTDLDKLLCGELVYSGSLRTNVAAIVHSIPIRNGCAGVSSELFALSADVHLILGNISEKQYVCETADGRGKTVSEALARLARVVCADTEMLTRREIVDMAKHVYKEQISQVAEGLSKVYNYTKKQVSGKVPIVVTGLGKDFIARKAAEKIGADIIVNLSMLIQNDAAMTTPAFGVALMTACKLEGDVVKWTP